eukprot:5472940-Lingulodinium_polyedra.AAC.1
MRDPGAFVTSQARRQRVEVSLRKCSAEGRELFHEAMRKEVSGWLTAEAVRIVSRAGVDPSRLLRC